MYDCHSELTLSLPVTHICVNFSTVYNNMLVAKGLSKFDLEQVFEPANSSSQDRCQPNENTVISSSLFYFQGLTKLEFDVIELVNDADHSVEEEEKVSSSTSRKRSLGTLMRKPKVPI